MTTKEKEVIRDLCYTNRNPDFELFSMVKELILKEDMVCVKARQLLNSFHLYLEQGFVPSLSSKARKKYLEAIEEVQKELGEPSNGYLP